MSLKKHPKYDMATLKKNCITKIFLDIIRAEYIFPFPRLLVLVAKQV